MVFDPIRLQAHVLPNSAFPTETPPFLDQRWTLCESPRSRKASPKRNQAKADDFVADGRKLLFLSHFRGHMEAAKQSRPERIKLGGCGLLGVGVWLSVSQGSFATLSPSFPSLSAANLIITLGTVVMITGFLGCLGAIKENKCLLLSFFIVLLIILFAELVLLILFFVYTEKVSENAKKDLKEGLVLYNTDNNVGLRDAWNAIQGEWRCCGVMGHTDGTPHFKSTKFRIGAASMFSLAVATTRPMLSGQGVAMRRWRSG
ncbi:hypothetical protein WMY93_023782 [Mugilogobius chulae]|uniref:Tetraspanin n=1 Tax=Mugilogobius chulae TaxID=88201 RepID=A0AAW0NHK2_9GOBI